MGLFEIQRISDAWPCVRNVQALKSLTRVGNEETEGVWLLRDHVIISQRKKPCDVCEVRVYSRVPLGSKELNEMEEPVLVNPPGVYVVNVLPLHSSSFIIVMLNGMAHFLTRSNADGCQWEVSSMSLSSRQVLAAAISGGRSLLYCERQGEGDMDCCLMLRTINIAAGGMDVSDAILLLSDCPSVILHTIDGGVWVVPSNGNCTPNNLFVFWTENSITQLIPYVWNSHVPIPQHLISSSITSYKMLILRTAWLWSKAPENPGIVTMSTHPLTNQLLILCTDGGVYQLQWSNGRFDTKEMARLKENHQRYLLKAGGTQILSTPEIFVIHSYIGLCWKGELRLYDSFTGEFVWESDDLEHKDTRLLPVLPCQSPTNGSFHTSPPPVALWNASGIFFLKCKRIVDHAQFFSGSLFPIATNADETTPGKFLDNGQLFAAQLCHLWGLHLLASKCTLDAAYSILKIEEDDDEDDDENDARSQQLLPELVSLLEQLSSQNPVVMVALLAQYPTCRHVVSTQVSQFLQSFYDENTVKLGNPLHTPFNIETVPLLEEYLQLSQKYDQVLTTSDHSTSLVTSARYRVCEILDVAHQHLSESSAAHCVELLSFASTSPDETLSGIKDFMRLNGSFAEAAKAVSEGKFETDINWRHVLSSEIAERGRENVLQSSMNNTRIPVFEQTCRLLYQLFPDDLIHFVRFCRLVREQHSNPGDINFAQKLRKAYFYQRALECLPAPLSASTEQIQVHCQLVLMSEQVNAELVAMTMLLENAMWSDAIHLLQQTHSQLSPALHTSLFHRVLLAMGSSGVLPQFIDTLWPLLPQRFNALDFISVLKSCHSPAVDGNDVFLPETSDGFTVDDILLYLSKLLSRQKVVSH